MIEIYSGDGKGKTTTSVGMAIRAAGHGIPVMFVQFLKDDSSGEISVLRNIEAIKVLHVRDFYGFTFQMTEIETENTKQMYQDMVAEVLQFEKEDFDDTAGIDRLIILDEVLYALNYGLLSQDDLCRVLDEANGKTEIILTGRGIPDWLNNRADYISEITKLKHPYDSGVIGRLGVEY